MSIKRSAITLYLKLVNQWIESLKAVDLNTLRFIRGHSRLFLMLAKKRRSNIFAVSNIFKITVPASLEINFSTTTDMRASGIARIPPSSNILEQEVEACVLTTMRSMSLRMLLYRTGRFGFRHTNVHELICFIRQHPRRFQTSGSIVSIIIPETYGHEGCIGLLTASHDKKSGIPVLEPVQAAQFARTADKQPIIAAGTQILILLTP